MKSEWKVSTIEQVCNLVTDGAHYSPPSVERGEYMVSVKDFTEYGFDFTACRKISKEDYDKLYEAGCVPQKKDILVGKDGARFFEDIILYKQEEKPALLSSIAILRVDEKQIIPAYLYYYLKTPNIKKDVRDNYGSGSAIPRIVLKDFKRMPVSYPPLPIQRKIASILSALDDKIETNNAICRNLEELLLAVYRNVKYENECVVKELNTLAEFSKNKKQISELNCQTFFSTENMLPGKAGAVAAASLPTMPKVTACNPGDILVSNIRPYFKKIVYCSTKCGCSSDVLCFHPKEEVYSTWLFCSLYEDDFFDYVTAGSKGTKMPRGDKAHIMRYGIAVPARTKLEEFKSTGDLVLSQINCLRSENERLNKLREVILPKLMNGKLDIENIKA